MQLIKKIKYLCSILCLFVSFNLFSENNSFYEDKNCDEYFQYECLSIESEIYNSNIDLLNKIYFYEIDKVTTKASIDAIEQLCSKKLNYEFEIYCDIIITDLHEFNIDERDKWPNKSASLTNIQDFLSESLDIIKSPYLKVDLLEFIFEWSDMDLETLLYFADVIISAHSEELDVLRLIYDLKRFAYAYFGDSDNQLNFAKKYYELIDEDDEYYIYAKEALLESYMNTNNPYKYTTEVRKLGIEIVENYEFNQFPQEQISAYFNLMLIEKINDNDERFSYFAEKVISGFEDAFYDLGFLNTTLINVLNEFMYIYLDITTNNCELIYRLKNLVTYTDKIDNQSIFGLSDISTISLNTKKDWGSLVEIDLELSLKTFNEELNCSADSALYEENIANLTSFIESQILNIANEVYEDNPLRSLYSVKEIASLAQYYEYMEPLNYSQDKKRVIYSRLMKEALSRLIFINNCDSKKLECPYYSDNLYKTRDFIDIFTSFIAGINYMNEIYVPSFLNNINVFLKNNRDLLSEPDEISINLIGNIAWLSTVELYEKGFWIEAEKIFNDYFIEKNMTEKKSFMDLISSPNQYSVGRLMMAMDILYDGTYLHSSKSTYKDYENNLIEIVLSERMSTFRNKYEILEIQKFFENKIFDEYFQLDKEVVNLNMNDLKENEISAYSDLFKSSESLSREDFLIIKNQIFPDISLEDYQKSLKVDELILVNTVLEVGYSFYLYIVGISSEDFVINRVEISDLIYEEFDLDEVIIFSNRSKTEVLSRTWKKYQDSIYASFITKTQDYDYYRDLLSDIHLSGFEELLERSKKIYFVSNFNDTFNPSILFYKDRWLAENFEVNLYQSLNSLFKGLNQENKYKDYDYVGFGSSNFNFSKDYKYLESAEKEIQEASKKFSSYKTYLNENFNENNVLNSELEEKVIHFATHNDFIQNDENLLIPALVTNMPIDEKDGYLDTFEISTLNLSNSLVILSACETSKSINQDSDSFSGLVKSFKVAGARDIVATRWIIETSSANVFIEKYLDYLKTGKSSSGSIFAAKKEFINSQQYSHPYYWASYFNVN